MSAVLEGIFLALTLVPMAQEFFPRKENSATKIRVGAGLAKNGDGGASTGGGIPNIALFDNNGNRLGFKQGKGEIKDGRYADITVEHIDSGNNMPASYISLSAESSNALCISYLAITWVTGDSFQFFGDAGKQCGMPWYPSNQQVPTQQNPNYRPPCVWIDGFDDNGHKTSDSFPQAFSFHVSDFQFSNSKDDPRAMGYQSDPDTMCKAPARFATYTELSELNCIPVYDPPLEYKQDGTDPEDRSAIIVPGKVQCDPHPGTKPDAQQIMKLRKFAGSGRMGMRPTYGVPKKRGSIRARNNTMANGCEDERVIISKSEAHSAREVCESDTSAGPDFVSTREGLYCDMCTHTLYEVCKDANAQNCFDVQTQKMRKGGRLLARNAGGPEVPHKEYKEAITWGEDEDGR